MKVEKKIIKAKPKPMAIAALKEKEAEYDADFFKWTRDQAAFLKKKAFSKLDIIHLIEEIESLGNSERNAIESHLIILFLHLLKIQYQPAMRCNSWNNSVENAKFRISRLVQKNPSLKKKIPELFSDAYFSARLQASSETGLDSDTFPKQCPWTFNQLFPALMARTTKRKR